MAGGNLVLKHQENMTRKEKEKENGHNCEFTDIPSQGFPS